MSSRIEDPVEILKKGAEEWNEFRSRSDVDLDLAGENLSGLNLSLCDLGGLNLQSANLEKSDCREANLEAADLRGAFLNGANLEHASMARCNLSDAQGFGANFHGAELYRTSLVRSQLEGAHFVGAQLEHSVMSFANLRSASFDRADVTSAYLDDADLRGAILDEANLTGSDLRHSNLERASMNGASLENCDLRGARGLELDATYVWRTKFSPNSRDQWSLIRRAYTGPMFLFHILFLIAFLIPYFVRSAVWVIVNRSQEIHAQVGDDLLARKVAARSVDEMEIANLNERLAGIWEEYQLAPESFLLVESALTKLPLETRTELSSALVDSFDKISPCLAPECQPSRPVLLVLLGLGDGIFRVLLACSLLLYNVLRGALTRQVSMLREAEERSGFSPRKQDYRPLYLAHRFLMVPLFWVAVIAVVVNGWEYLIETKIILPAGSRSAGSAALLTI